MPSGNKAHPKTVRERTGRLLKMAGSLASQELLRRIQKQNLAGSPLFNIAQVKLLVSELGHLKGAAMKLGQMLALEARDYFPEEVCVILDQLQSNVSFLEFSTIDEILRKELGIKFADFVEISQAPIAAASIGQVHRAQLRDGKELAVKIQYPEILDSLQSDVKILSGLLKTASLLMRKEVDLTGLVQEFSEIFAQEADYLKEAFYTEAYRDKALQVPELDVPAVFKEYSTMRVLSLEFKKGSKFPHWIESDAATVEARMFYGKLILDLYTREFCEWGLVQTDPNLGNFLFQPRDRRLVLLDFGATKHYDVEFRTKYSQLICSVAKKQEYKMIQISEEMGLVDPRESPEAKSIFKKLLLQSMTPIISKEYDFSESSYPEQMRALSRKLVSALKYSPPPKDLIFLHRKLSGVFYILKHLKVKLPLNKYMERFERLAQENVEVELG